jgi:ABC-type lipoprotein release transport system permease subunit
LWATILAIIATFIASYVPARRAAQLAPVETLRGSSA